ncbi:hypothetical protein C900_02849 [Fulvivirga imtechensis AK7]|uniref:Uncharacterized protein n=1 Tax=Fulvivirga imtechensis AK7 TaxID=1237149 RepID=L8JUL4_9BACT|nr:hypothetical protein [Fulvivirga imtechensis]ELR71234.1 hypothetical protein C900_02849 [Fulvivirga imtechensis AK7]
MRLIIIILLCCCGVTFNANAQKEKKKKKTSKAEQVDRSNAFEPHVPEKAMAPAKTKRSKKQSFRARYNKNLDKKKEEFQKRMEANAKAYKKMQRQMEKPQYSDPMYFGHKKKPKKRPPGKRKFCHECGIVH